VVGPKIIDGDLIRLGVAHDPLIGLQAVVAGAEVVNDLVDTATILDSHAGAEGHGRALNVKRRLLNRGFGQNHSGVVLVPVRAAPLSMPPG